MDLAYYILIPLLIVMAISFSIFAWLRIHRRSKRRQREQIAVQDTSHMTDEEFQAHIGRESRRTRAAQRASRGVQQAAQQPQAFPEIEGYYAPEAPAKGIENGGDSEATSQLRGYYEPDLAQRPPPPTGGNSARPVFG